MVDELWAGAGSDCAHEIDDGLVKSSKKSANRQKKSLLPLALFLRERLTININARSVMPVISI